MYNERELFAIWIDSFNDLEYKHKIKLFEGYKGGTFSDSLLPYERYLTENVGQNVYNVLIKADNDTYKDYVLSALYRKEIKCITLASDNYPSELKEVPCPPIVLYAKGNVNLLKEKKFSIVGSRKTLPFALAKAREITSDLNNADVVVVTGLAEGGDEAVVSEGIKNGKIISVIAGGFDNIYPKTNVGLYNEVVKNGLVLSEYPPEIPTLPFHFPVRNRIIAGLGMGTLVISGARKSGTFYTAEYADSASRQVFAFPYSINVASGEGCNNLIRHGAMLTLSSEDILSYYNIEKKEKKQVVLSEIETTVYEIIKENEVHIDKLCQLTGKKAYELAPVLSMLEIKKLIVKLGGNKYSRV